VLQREAHVLQVLQLHPKIEIGYAPVALFLEVFRKLGYTILFSDMVFF
jgi:hypothetical protein